MITSATVEVIALTGIEANTLPAVKEEGVKVIEASRSRSFTMSVTVRPSAFNHDDEEIMRLEVIYLAQAAALRLLRKENLALQKENSEWINWDHEFHIGEITFNTSEV